MRWFSNLFKRQPRSDEQSGSVRQPAEADDYALRHPAGAPEEKPAPPMAAPAALPSTPVQAARMADPRQPEPRMNDEAVARRARRAAESLLENEALTADLDDHAAKALLKWGEELSRNAAAKTAGLDDEQAEEAMSERMRATRQLLRSVNKWIAGQSSLAAEEKSALLVRIQEHLGTIYGADFAAPDAAHLEAFIRDALQYSNDPAQVIARLHDLYQPPPGSI